jgi:hypothetical protein
MKLKFFKKTLNLDNKSNFGNIWAKLFMLPFFIIVGVFKIQFGLVWAKKSNQIECFIYLWEIQAESNQKPIQTKLV